MCLSADHVFTASVDSRVSVYSHLTTKDASSLVSPEKYRTMYMRRVDHAARDSAIHAGRLLCIDGLSELAAAGVERDLYCWS